MNRGGIAHIISDSPKGARVPPTLSEELSQNFDHVVM
jgi:hypothetical protein